MDASTGNERQFSLQCRIGRGGYGEVFLAEMVRPPGIRSTVAVKFVSKQEADGNVIARLKDEARMLARVSHPVVLQFLDFVVLDGRFALVTEFVEGWELNRLVRTHGPLPPAVCMEVALQVADALHAAWSTTNPQTGAPLQLLHRDIKPSNIMVSRHGGVKLLDFGVASADIDRNVQTTEGVIPGSLRYMAPERITRMLNVPEGDVFSLGCVFAELLVGRPMLEGLALPGLLHVASDLNAMRARRDNHLAFLPVGLSPSVRTLLVAMLDPEPENRPTMQEVVAILEQRVTGRAIRNWTKGLHWARPVPADSISHELILETPLDEGQTQVFSESEAVDPMMAAPLSPGESSQANRGWFHWSLGLVVLAPIAVMVGVWFWEPAQRDAADANDPEIPIVFQESAAPSPVSLDPPAGSEVVMEALDPPVPPVADPVVPPSEEVTVVGSDSPSSEPADEETIAPVAEGMEVAEEAAVVVTEEPSVREVVVSSQIPVELRQAGQPVAHDAISDGPVQVWADYGDGLVETLTLSVAAGASVQVQCSRLRQRCWEVAP